MSLIVKINSTTELPLVEWDAVSFISSPRLKIASDDLATVKTIFSEIEKLEIFRDDNLVGVATEYDRYSSIQYLGTVYSPAMNTFTECLQVDLQKTSLAEQVERLTAEIFPVTDFEHMTTEQYRTWLLKEIEKDCQADIYAGTSIEISTGTKHFRYTMEDQQNLGSIVALLMSVPELPAMPYHADGEFCYLMPKADILLVYLTLHMRLLAITTRCNHMNMWIKSIQTKEELMDIDYSTPLPQEYQDQVDAIMARAIEMEELLIAHYLPVRAESDTTEPEEETQAEEPEVVPDEGGTE